MCGCGEGVAYDQECDVQGVCVGEDGVGLGFDHFSVGNYDFSAVEGFLGVVSRDNVEGWDKSECTNCSLSQRRTAV